MSLRKIKGFPLEIRDMDSEDIAEQEDLFQGTMREYIHIGPKGYFIPKHYEEYLGDIYNMPLRPTDIFVTSYQRSGTTWTQELVWLVVNNLDYETAASILLTKRYCFPDMPMLVNDTAKQIFLESHVNNRDAHILLKEVTLPPKEVLASAPSPRFVKTHFPFSLLPPTLLDTAKVVYVARDPRDVIVSSYHNAKLLTVMGYAGNFKQFWNLFIKDKFLLTPYFEHVKEAWTLRHHQNMLFIFYEELLTDLAASIHKVCSFLGKRYTEEQIAVLCEHLSFDKFKNNPSVNIEEMNKFGVLNFSERFIRKGKVGGWREYFDSEITQQAERWILDNLKDTDLRFPTLGDIHV